MRMPLLFLIIILTVSCSQSPKVETTSTKHEIEGNHVDSLRSLVRKISLNIRENPTNDELFSQRANCYFDLDMLDSAINDLEIASRLKPERIGYLLRRADMELLRGQADMAKTLLLRILEKHPNHLEANLKLANLYMILDQLEDAEKILGLVLKADKTIAEAYLMRSMVYQLKGDYDKALGDLQKAVYYKPDYYEAQNMLGLVYSYKANDLAIDHYKNAIQLRPYEIEPRYNLGFYYQETNRPKQAIELYQQILNQIDSTALDPLFNIGYIYQQQEKYSESIPYFSKAAKYHPYEPRVFYRLALSYENLNQRDSAIAYYRRTLDIEPDFEEAFNAIDNLTKK